MPAISRILLHTTLTAEWPDPPPDASEATDVTSEFLESADASATTRYKQGSVGLVGLQGDTELHFWAEVEVDGETAKLVYLGMYTPPPRDLVFAEFRISEATETSITLAWTLYDDLDAAAGVNTPMTVSLFGTEQTPTPSGTLNPSNAVSVINLPDGKAASEATVTGLTPYTQYYVYATAQSSDGNRQTETPMELVVRTPDTTPPFLFDPPSPSYPPTTPDDVRQFETVYQNSVQAADPLFPEIEDTLFGREFELSSIGNYKRLAIFMRFVSPGPRSVSIMFEDYGEQVFLEFKPDDYGNGNMTFSWSGNQSGGGGDLRDVDQELSSQYFCLTFEKMYGGELAASALYNNGSMRHRSIEAFNYDTTVWDRDIRIISDSDMYVAPMKIYDTNVGFQELCTENHVLKREWEIQALNNNGLPLYGKLVIENLVRLHDNAGSPTLFVMYNTDDDVENAREVVVERDYSVTMGGMGMGMKYHVWVRAEDAAGNVFAPMRITFPGGVKTGTYAGKHVQMDAANEDEWVSNNTFANGEQYQRWRYEYMPRTGGYFPSVRFADSVSFGSYTLTNNGVTMYAAWSPGDGPNPSYVKLNSTLGVEYRPDDRTFRETSGQNSIANMPSNLSGADIFVTVISIQRSVLWYIIVSLYALTDLSTKIGNQILVQYTSLDLNLEMSAGATLYRGGIINGVVDTDEIAQTHAYLASAWDTEDAVVVVDSVDPQSQVQVRLPRAVAPAQPLYAFLEKPAGHHLHLRATLRGPVALSAAATLRLAVYDENDPGSGGFGVTFEGANVRFTGESTPVPLAGGDASCPGGRRRMYSASVHSPSGGNGAMVEARVYPDITATTATPTQSALASAAEEDLAAALAATRVYGAVEVTGGEQMLPPVVDALEMRAVPPPPAVLLGADCLVVDAVDSVMELDGAESGEFGHPQASYLQNSGSGVLSWFAGRSSASSCFEEFDDVGVPTRPASLFDGVSFSGDNQALMLNSAVGETFDPNSMTAFAVFRMFAEQEDDNATVFANQGHGGSRFYFFHDGVELVQTRHNFPDEHMPKMGRWSVVAGRVDGAAQTLWIDGVRFLEKSEESRDIRRNFSLGMYPSGIRFFAGEIGEVVMCARPMTDEEVRWVNAYLMSKWRGEIPDWENDLALAEFRMTASTETSITLAWTLSDDADAAAGVNTPMTISVFETEQTPSPSGALNLSNAVSVINYSDGKAVSEATATGLTPYMQYYVYATAESFYGDRRTETPAELVVRTTDTTPPFLYDPPSTSQPTAPVSVRQFQTVDSHSVQAADPLYPEIADTLFGTKFKITNIGSYTYLAFFMRFVSPGPKTVTMYFRHFYQQMFMFNFFIELKENSEGKIQFSWRGLDGVDGFEEVNNELSAQYFCFGVEGFEGLKGTMLYNDGYKHFRSFESHLSGYSINSFVDLEITSDADMFLAPMQKFNTAISFSDLCTENHILNREWEIQAMNTTDTGEPMYGKLTIINLDRLGDNSGSPIAIVLYNTDDDIEHAKEVVLDDSSTIGGLGMGMTYHVWVRAEDAAGNVLAPMRITLPGGIRCRAYDGKHVQMDAANEDDWVSQNTFANGEQDQRERYEYMPRTGGYFPAVRFADSVSFGNYTLTDDGVTMYAAWSPGYGPDSTYVKLSSGLGMEYRPGDRTFRDMSDGSLITAMPSNLSGANVFVTVITLEIIGSWRATLSLYALTDLSTEIGNKVLNGSESGTLNLEMGPGSTLYRGGILHGAVNRDDVAQAHAYLASAWDTEDVVVDSVDPQSQVQVRLPRAVAPAQPLYAFLEKPAGHQWHLRATLRGLVALSAAASLRLAVYDENDPGSGGFGVTFEGANVRFTGESTPMPLAGGGVSSLSGRRSMYSASVHSPPGGSGAMVEARVYPDIAVTTAAPTQSALAAVTSELAAALEATRVYGAVEVTGGEQMLPPVVDALEMRAVPPPPAVLLGADCLVVDAVDSVMKLDGAESGEFGHPHASYLQNSGSGVLSWFAGRSSASSCFEEFDDVGVPTRPASLFDGVSFSGENQALMLNSAVDVNFNPNSMTAFAVFRMSAEQKDSTAKVFANRGYWGSRFYFFHDGVELVFSRAYFPDEYKPKIGRWSVVAGRVDGEAQTSWIDGVRFLERSEENREIKREFSLGMYPAKNNFFAGEIGEVIMCARPMTGEEVNQVNAYLMSKWRGEIPDWGKDLVGDSEGDENDGTDVWEFYSLGSAAEYHCINFFAYTGAGSYSLDINHVELVNPHSSSGGAQAMDANEETGFSQIVFSNGSTENPLLAFRIRIPTYNTVQIPATGWQWVQRAVLADQLGSWKIVRNGVELPIAYSPNGSLQAIYEG